MKCFFVSAVLVISTQNNFSGQPFFLFNKDVRVRRLQSQTLLQILGFFLQWKPDFPLKEKTNVGRLWAESFSIWCPLGRSWYLIQMSATNTSISVTFLGCCFWHSVYNVSLLIISQTFMKTLAFLRNVLF